jgi:hypothetical protein
MRQRTLCARVALRAPQFVHPQVAQAYEGFLPLVEMTPLTFAACPSHSD